jgi:hypothetical protein
MTIKTKVVPESKRMDFMPKHYGVRGMIGVESRIYSYATEGLQNLDHTPAYRGGYWEFVEAEGAGWMYPTSIPDQVRLGPVCRGQFGGNVKLSREAAGLALTIIAVNHEWNRNPENDALGEEWNRLMEVAYQHPEARSGLMEWLD